MRNVMVLLLLVAAIGVSLLQYRWIGEVSAAEEQRARAALDFAARNFADELEREMLRTIDAFSRGEDDDIAARYDAWLAGAPNQRLIRTVWIAHPDTHDLSRFDPDTGSVVDVTNWPAELEPMREVLGPGPHPRAPFIGSVPAFITPIRRNRGGGRPPRREESFLFGGPIDGPPSAVILQLDRDYLTRVWLPELAKRYFHGEYDVVVSDHRRVVYRSNGWDGARPDATWPLFEGRDPEGPDERFTWRLLMRSHGGPLADAIALTRRRNLAISFAILAILIGSIAMLTVIARRANRQRVQQLEFVAGITHELNTPLAALASAGQNLADGVVRDGEQMKRYGTMIVKEARRLSETVAQVLDYAGLQAGGGLRTVAPIDVSTVIEDAVSHSRWLAEERRVQLEVNVPRELPSLDGDAAALGRALQNLIVNAIRHGGSGGWVGVRAVVDRGAISITIEDRGPGIPARDIDHLFEPFYRGKESGRVRGTGLGLTIVKQIANAHGGTVSIEKRRERGAAFTVKLPVRAAASHAEVAVV